MTSILFHEADNVARTVLCEFLRKEGFVVLEAGDMAEAVRACDEYGGTVDLAIVRAQQDGQLIERLAKRYPEVRVLFLGGVESGTALRLPPEVKFSHLPDPFTTEELLDTVRRVIDSRILRAAE